MKKITLLILTGLLSTSSFFGQLVIKSSFFETQSISNTGLISGYEAQAGPYSLWNPDANTFVPIGGAAPGFGVGGAAKFASDGNMMSGTSYVTETAPTTWVKKNTGFNYIFKGLAFFGGANATGFAAGESLTYNGDGIVIKTYDGGETWEQVWSGAGKGIEAMSFPNEYTGYIGGWSGYFAKTTSGGSEWVEQSPGTDVYYYTAITFKDDYNGVVAALTNNDGAKIYTTSDGGENWVAGSGITGVPQKIIHTTENTYFLVTNGGDIQKSTDGGLTWTTQFSPGGVLLGINFYDAMNGIATGENNVYRTTDGGTTWIGQQVIEGALWRDVAWLDANNVTLVGTPELIFESQDGGLTWPKNNLATSTLNEALYEITFTENGTGYIIGSQGVLFKKLPENTTFSVMSKYNVATKQWTVLDSFNFPVDGSLSQGYNISGDGSTVVGSAWITPTAGESGLPVVATAWTAEKGLINLGSLYMDINRSTRANAVSQDGKIIVGWQDFSGPWKAALWKQGTDGNYLPNQYLLVDKNGDPTDEYNQLGEALVISEDGKWIGGIGDYANNNEPWLWSEEGGYKPLGTLNENFTGFVNGLNADGSVAIGFFQGGPFDANIPFIWTEAGGLKNLNTYITDTLGYSLGEGSVWSPTAISPNGKYISGWGFDPSIGEFGELFTFRLQLSGALSVTNAVVKSISIYPNPVQDILYLTGKKNLKNIEIYNVTGQKLLTQKIGAQKAEINVSKLTSGMYIVVITTDDNKTETYKIIKK